MADLTARIAASLAADQAAAKARQLDALKRLAKFGFEVTAKSPIGEYTLARQMGNSTDFAHVLPGGEIFCRVLDIDEVH